MVNGNRSETTFPIAARWTSLGRAQKRLQAEVLSYQIDHSDPTESTLSIICADQARDRSDAIGLFLRLVGVLRTTFATLLLTLSIE